MGYEQNLLANLCINILFCFFSHIAPYHIALKERNLQLCDHIIKRSRNMDHWIVYAFGIIWGVTPTLDVVFKVTVNQTSQHNCKNTPLHIAATYGNLELCKLIIFHHKDNSKNIDGNTPLLMAAANGHLEVCKYIIEKFEDKNPANNKGDTPLHFAARNNHLEICKIIIDKAWITLFPLD